MSNSVEESIYKKLREGRKNGLAKSLKESSNDNILEPNDGSILEFIATVKEEIASGSIDRDERSLYRDLFIAMKTAASSVGIKFKDSVVIESRGGEPWNSGKLGSGWVEGDKVEYDEDSISLWDVTSMTNEELGLIGLYFRPREDDGDRYIVIGK